MEVGTLLVFAICACVVAGVLRQYSPGFAIVFSLGCACFLLLRGLALARPVFDFLNQLNSQLNGDALACVWKAAGILVLTQAVQDVCREAGHAALAGRVEMLGRLAALAAALPLVHQFAALAAGLLG
ncbi:MAG: SpoIIIAC/SpoIIIAD family protein [Ruthenibacterium sp.]|nr:SpoIIIAC/SpoIIIAD family protein [Ruthenibacterium sp.]